MEPSFFVYKLHQRDVSENSFPLSFLSPFLQSLKWQMDEQMKFRSSSHTPTPSPKAQPGTDFSLSGEVGITVAVNAQSLTSLNNFYLL